MPRRDEPASVNALQPSAVRKARSPSRDADWPPDSRRKSRCRSASRTRTRPDAAVTASMRQSYPAVMPDRIRVACVQLTSRADKAENLEKTERLVAKAAASGA